jgi:hypothetical protein
MHRDLDRQVGARYGARYSIWISWLDSQLKGLEKFAYFALATREIRESLDRSTVCESKGVWKLRVISSRIARSLWASLRKTY